MEVISKDLNLEALVDEHLDDIISIIKDNYPDIDIFSRIRYTSAKETKQIVEEVKKKNPGIKLFYVDIPYFGVIVYRSQTIRDMREVSVIGVANTEKLIEEHGGVDKINNMPEFEKIRIQKDITDETNNLIHVELLKRCVLYPYDFTTLVEEETLPFGVSPTMIEALVESSGYGNIRIEEI